VLQDHAAAVAIAHLAHCAGGQLRLWPRPMRLLHLESDNHDKAASFIPRPHIGAAGCSCRTTICLDPGGSEGERYAVPSLELVLARGSLCVKIRSLFSSSHVNVLPRSN
jgi:hypothetical protein